jgi:hypothetical protein
MPAAKKSARTPNLPSLPNFYAVPPPAGQAAEAEETKVTSTPPWLLDAIRRDETSKPISEGRPRSGVVLRAAPTQEELEEIHEFEVVEQVRRLPPPLPRAALAKRAPSVVAAPLSADPAAQPFGALPIAKTTPPQARAPFVAALLHLWAHVVGVLARYRRGTTS